MASTSGTYNTTCVVADPAGLHLRPAASIVQVASQFDADVTVEHDGKRANGKSILSMCMLAAQVGARLTVSAIGQDAIGAIQAIEDVFVRLFGADPAFPPTPGSAVRTIRSLNRTGKWNKKDT